MPENDPLIISLKHVVPQKPEGNWLHMTEDDVNLAPMTPSDAHFREAFADARVTKAVLARYYLRSQRRSSKLDFGGAGVVFGDWTRRGLFAIR
jgi:hypothetical protein